MRKLLLLLLLVGSAMSAQTVTVLSTYDTLQKPTYQQFIILNDGTDISESVKVATIKSVGSLKKPVDIFYSIREKAQKLGANSFRFESFTKNPDQTGELILTAYYTTGEVFDVNFQNINSIYIFGDDDLTSSKKQSYRVDGNKYEIGAGQFKRFNLKLNQEMKISKGGITGMAVWVANETGRAYRFYSFSGIGVANGGMAISSGGGMGVGVGITTGKIHNVEQNLAMLLTKMYEEQK